MFRIAVPNKGSLSEPAVAMLREAGYKQRRDTRELVLADPDNGVEFSFCVPVTLPSMSVLAPLTRELPAGTYSLTRVRRQ